MSDITKDDVTVNLDARDIQVFYGTKIASLPTIVFGGDSEEYVANGVPLPDKGHFGCKRQIDRLMIQEPAAEERVYRYDPENHTIRIYEVADDGASGFELGEIANGTALAETKLPALVIGE